MKLPNKTTRKAMEEAREIAFFDRARNVAKQLDAGTYGVPVAYKDEWEFYTPEQYESFDDDLREGLIPLYLKGNSMNAYQVSWEVETVQYKLENVAHIVDLLASDIADNTHSGALWSVHDTLKSLSAQLENLAQNVYESTPDKKKAKKK
jgi:hypothetical protein